MESEGRSVIRVGSRKSELALIQTNFVIDSLKKIYPDKEFKIVTMTTLGDRILNVSLPKIGEKSLFTKDLEDALKNNTVDFVVHSLKDLPTALPEGLAIGAVFERDDPRDALVLREDNKEFTLSTLPPGSVIGTSSLRRTAQLKGAYPHLNVQDVRGNLNTRLRKLDSPTKEYNALLLANAGLQRMGWGHRVSKDPDITISHLCMIRIRTIPLLPNFILFYVLRAGSYHPHNNDPDITISHLCMIRIRTIPLLPNFILFYVLRAGSYHPHNNVLPCAEIMYAVGQGALAVECRCDNDSILEMLAPFSHVESYCRVLAERSFLATLGGGCSAPVGVSTKIKPIDSQFKLSITGAVWSLDGATKIEHTLHQTFDQIKKTQKHKLSPTEDEENKKIKFDSEIDPKNELANEINPIEELNRQIDKKTGDLNCEDTRTQAEIDSLKNKRTIFCGLTENTNIPVDVIINCDKLGRDLAEALIDKGAIAVMKVTQDYIRSSTIKNS